MFNLDSLSLKYFFEENFDFINGALVQKIQQPSRSEIILNVRNLNVNTEKFQNKKLYININPKYPHICFVDENSLKLRNIKFQTHPPMFCMQLRKYLNGSKIKDFKIIKYERILELYFDYFDEAGSLAKLCLALEFMGKHSNIILYNALNKTIIGSIHNISHDKSSVREIFGGIKYIYPPLKEKSDILNINYSTFCETIKNKDIKEISDNFYYFSQGILREVFQNKGNLKDVFSYLQQLQNGLKPEFISSFWRNCSCVFDEKNPCINDAINDYFSKIMFDEILKKQKNELKNFLEKDYKKYSKTANYKPDSTKINKYKICGDLIIEYMHLIKQGQRELVIEGNKIKLDENLTASKNAQKYYQKYKKEKTAFEYNLRRYNEAKEKLKYLETVLFNIDNAIDFDGMKEIYLELSKNGFIKTNSIQNKKENKKPNIEKINYGGFEIFIGKNNEQNDFLISKIARDEDLWFHGQNFPSSHVVLKIPNNKKIPDKDVIEFCAKLTKENSKAKISPKASIIMTKRKNLKKPPHTYPGYVTYKNEIEITI